MYCTIKYMSSKFNMSRFVAFEWHEANINHILKHDVNYKEYEQVFFNKPLLIRGDEIHSDKEKRYQVLGKSDNNRLLFIVFTIRGDQIRVISARNQNKNERQKYEKI